MKHKLKATIAALATMAVVATVFALPALATDMQEGYYTVAWEMPDEGKWPQTLHAYEYTGQSKNLGVLDDQLDECEKYQVDIYKIDSDRDVKILTWLIEKGTLGLNKDGKPEDNKIYHSSKIVEAQECQSTTTSSTSSTSTSSTSSTTSTTSTSLVTTTTTLPETTTTEPDETTTTTVADSSSTSTPAPVVASTTAPSELPFTGFDGGLVVVLFAGLGLLGGLILYLTKTQP